jgi:hypothetical protein
MVSPIEACSIRTGNVRWPHGEEYIQLAIRGVNLFTKSYLNEPNITKLYSLRNVLIDLLHQAQSLAPILIRLRFARAPLYR